MGVSPFGNPRIEAYLQLPAAYRSLSRPSSAPDAKAFTLCSCSLELFAIGLSTFCCSKVFFLLPSEISFRRRISEAFSVLNCLSFFVHFSVAVKKLSLFHRFLLLSSCFARISPLSTRRNCIFYPTLLKDQYFLNICPQYLFVSTLSLLFGFQ